MLQVVKKQISKLCCHQSIISSCLSFYSIRSYISNVCLHVVTGRFYRVFSHCKLHHRICFGRESDEMHDVVEAVEEQKGKVLEKLLTFSLQQLVQQQ